ncbi:MAG: histidine phosphatase family protein [Kiritimatiellales bacterium]|nr:histidine phosphatase family protein [Kiritimatiellota bacterium]MBL7011789.1 histidine phosphatase family protein [Kiritimatiellales bacterium]
MKTLILVRHGDFIHKDPFVPNIGRPLTRQGRHDLVEVAKRFAALNIVPDLILTSPARRTGETAEIFGKKLGLNASQMKVDEELFEAEKREILRVVHQLDESLDTVMLVGHDPAMTSLLHHLVNAEIYNLKYASFAVLSIDGQWRDAAFGRSALLHLDVPVAEPMTIGWREKFAHWRRERIQKIELAVVFVICLLIIMTIFGLLMYFGADSVVRTGQ